MRATNRQRLRQELIQAGAKTSEINELVSIAGKLQLLKAAEDHKDKTWLRLLKPLLLVSLPLTVGV